LFFHFSFESEPEHNENKSNNLPNLISKPIKD
jgi:hypothetical protein